MITLLAFSIRHGHHDTIIKTQSLSLFSLSLAHYFHLLGSFFRQCQEKFWVLKSRDTVLYLHYIEDFVHVTFKAQDILYYIPRAIWCHVSVTVLKLRDMYRVFRVFKNHEKQHQFYQALLELDEDFYWVPGISGNGLKEIIDNGEIYRKVEKPAVQILDFPKIRSCIRSPWSPVFTTSCTCTAKTLYSHPKNYTDINTRFHSREILKVK